MLIYPKKLRVNLCEFHAIFGYNIYLFSCSCFYYQGSSTPDTPSVVPSQPLLGDYIIADVNDIYIVLSMLTKNY